MYRYLSQTLCITDCAYNTDLVTVLNLNTIYKNLSYSIYTLDPVVKTDGRTVGVNPEIVGHSE
jgi:hypothetical protein